MVAVSVSKVIPPSFQRDRGFGSADERHHRTVNKVSVTNRATAWCLLDLVSVS